MFSNPHWKARLDEWLTLEEQIPFGLHLPLTEDEKEKRRNNWIIPPFKNPPLRDYFQSCYEVYGQSSLSLQQRLELVADGYTLLRSIVPPHIIEIANCTMTELLGSVDMSYVGDKAKMDPMQRNQDPYFLTGSINHLDLLALYYASPIVGIIDSLLYGATPGSGRGQGKGEWQPPVHGAQVAYRFSQPRPSLAPSFGGRQSLGGRGWHIDGLERGQYGSFSFLVGFALNDQPEEFSGNLCLHPGSHHALQPYLHAYALQSLAQVQAQAQARSSRSSSEDGRGQAARLPKPDLGEPVQVCLQAGDAVIALHKVAHRGGPNYSREVRRMLYFRVSHRRHAELRVRGLEDVWLEYEGLHDLVY